MTTETKPRRKKWKLAGGILLAVLVLLAGGFFWYVSDYYRAEERAGSVFFCMINILSQVLFHIGADHIEVVVDGQNQLGLIPAGQSVHNLFVGVLQLVAGLEVAQDMPAHIGDEAVDSGGEGPVNLDNQLVA